MQANVLVGTLLGEGNFVPLAQVCRVCRVDEQWVFELVSEGLVEPAHRNHGDWQFDSAGISRLQVATRLRRDLGVNPAGAALAMELMDEIKGLRRLLGAD